MTPKTVVLRRPSDGICICTNHFRSKELAVSTWCRRYAVLIKSASQDKIGISDLAKKLDAVNQGPLTMQNDDLRAGRIASAPLARSLPGVEATAERNTTAGASGEIRAGWQAKDEG